ncbi:hypothetical protein KY289_005181 [Solanum tuberosum]|nr:hypothetical protein KY289_005181 [Solanum tuberosum]
MTENVGTSSNFHVSPTFDADDYRENITQDEPIDPVNIDDCDLPNYGSPSNSDSDDLPNADESGDNVPFEASSSDDAFLMPNRSPRPMSMSPFKQLQRAVKLLHLKIAREYFVIKSTKKSWRLVCRRVEQGCRFRLTSFNEKHTNMWKVGRYIKEHTCDMGTCRDGHFNLDVEMIANVFRVDIEKTPRFPIKDCQTTFLKAYGISISRRKAYLGRNRAFEKVYERRVDVIEDVFNYVFWTFKPCIDGFVFCRPVISIDGTHVYGKYDIKLLIAIATDGNGSILPLSFAIVANESMETWSLYLDHLHLHVVKGRRDLALISDRHHGILSSMDGGKRWGMLTTNSSESFNGLLKSARGLPVTAMGFDRIGYQAWEHMTPEFSVRSYKKAYSGQFNPLGGEKYWLDSPFLMIVNKKYLRKVGVNKITRIHNEMHVPASTLTRKCSTCKQIGHDRRNCPSRARNASCGGSS